ncbi:hypothetical protein BH20GEM1_BH20GEM1_12280 [soil metagenome]
MTRLALLASLFVFALSPVAHAQNAWRDILERQMTAVGNTVTQQGYRSEPGAFHTDMIVGTLASGAGVGLEVDLEFGGDYMIVGVCDGDCTDLDLSLLDLDGNLLFEDELSDDAPILTFTAPKGGTHFLMIHMYACSVDPCSFGYKVYRR